MWPKRTRDPLPSGVFGERARRAHCRGRAGRRSHGQDAPPRRPDRRAGRARRLRRCAEPRAAPVATPTPTPGAALDLQPPKTGAFEAAVARRLEQERQLREAIARARRSPTVEGALRVARLTGRITPAAEARALREWASANATLGRALRRPPHGAGVRDRHGAHAGGGPRADLRPARADVPGAQHERPLLVARGHPGGGLAHDPRPRPRDLPVLPRPRPAAPAAGELGARQRDRRRLPGGHAQPHDQGPLPLGRAHAQPRPARRARRPPQRLPRVGVLLRLRLGLAAVGERDGAGDRGAGARARLPRAGAGALAPQRPARARRLRAGAAERRVGVRPGRPALPPVLVRARPTACSTAGCRP